MKTGQDLFCLWVSKSFRVARLTSQRSGGEALNFVLGQLAEFFWPNCLAKFWAEFNMIEFIWADHCLAEFFGQIDTGRIDLVDFFDRTSIFWQNLYWPYLS